MHSLRTPMLLLAILAMAMTLVLAGASSGCQSATKEVQKQASAVVGNAAKIEERADHGKAITDTGGAQTDDETSKAYFGEASKTFTEIKGLAGGSKRAGGVIQAQVPELQDKTPAWVLWLKTIGLVAATVLILALVFVFWHSGLSRLMAAILGRFSSTLEGQAKLDYEALEAAKASNNQETITAVSSMIAARRAKPAYNVAFELTKQRARLRG